MAPSISSQPPSATISRFKIVIVGAGIAGLLSAIGLRLDGNTVIVLEQASTFGEVGAGLRIPPNSFKILHRWGIDTTYLKKTYSNGNRFLRYDTGDIIADMPHGVPEWDFGGSYLKVHRADYHEILLNKALELGVDIRRDSRVEGYDWENAAAILSDGMRVEGDLIVVADGVQSKARPIFQGHELPPTDTGDVVYRLLIPGQDLLAEPEMRDLISQPWVSSWCGPDAHVIGYPIRGGEIYNVVFCCLEQSMQEQKMAFGETRGFIENNDELTRRFAEWEPKVRRLVELGKNFLKWKLYDLDMVERWVHPSNKGVLVGDAVHPMLPYMASGAAMACEDAATLRKALQGATRDTLPANLAKYQKLRQPRASVIQKAGRKLQDAYHLPDGPEQEERDRWMVQDDARNPIFWGHKERRKWLFGHDAEVF